MKFRSIKLAVIGLAVVLGAVSLPLLTTSTASAHAANAASAKPMTNKDVIKLTKLGFDGNVIKSKIDQAARVNFQLEVDDLVSLKHAGVSQDVISSMLNRTGGGSVASVGRGAGALNGAAVAGMKMGDVTMTTKDGAVRLRGINGSISTTNAFVTVLMYNNYPDTAATVRTHDKRPSFTVFSTNSPKGTVYIASLEVDQDDNVRSLKMGNSRFGGMKNVGAPDKSNQIPYDAVQVGNGNQWRLTPTKDLKPGEYGVLYGSLYDFGVDS